MAKHSLVRVKGSLVNTPHLIEVNSFNSIMEYVNKRIEGNAEIIPKAFEEDVTESTPKEDFYLYNDDTKTGILQVDGPITLKTTGWEALCGGTSCQMLKEQMEYFVDKGAKTVAMFVSSGGGEARGLFDAAKHIRKLADDNGIKIIAYTETIAASAAYALPAIADEFIASSDADIGSIGVLIQLFNNSKALEKDGYERVFVVSDEEKIPFARDGSFREEWIDDLQSQVYLIKDKFVEHVVTYRPMSAQQVKDTKARVFMAEEALQLGLIDKIMDVESFYNYLADFAQSNLEGNEMGNPLKDMFKLKTKEDKVEMAQLQELQALLETKEAELSASLEQITSLTATVSELQGSLASLQAFADERKAAAEAAQAEAQRIAEEQALAKLEARKAALSAVVAEDKFESLFAVLNTLDDAAFDLMVAHEAATKEARAESFKAVGNEGVESEDTSASERSGVDAIRQAGVENARAKFKR